MDVAETDIDVGAAKCHAAIRFGVVELGPLQGKDKGVAGADFPEVAPNVLLTNELVDPVRTVGIVLSLQLGAELGFGERSRVRRNRAIGIARIDDVV
jgi:hypothetical protein